MKIVLLSILILCLMVQGCKTVDADPVTLSFTRTWTAPGDDGMLGQATLYDGRYAQTQDSLMNFWNSCQVWISTAPKAPGETELYIFDIEVEIGYSYYYNYFVLYSRT